jgi:hypothetical protein
MAMKDEARARDGQIALGLLPEGTTLRDYIVGRANARLTRGAVITVVLFVVFFVAIALSSGRALLPGFLVFYILWRSIWPLRGIVVADRGLALVDRSFMRARPSRLIATVSLAEIAVSPRDQRRWVALAGETVSLRKNEYERLIRALNAPAWASPIPSPMPPNPSGDPL